MVKQILISCLLTMITYACASKNDGNFSEEESVKGEDLVLTSSAESLDLKQENKDRQAIKFTWTKGRDSQKYDLTYLFEIDIADNNFISSVQYSYENTFEHSFTVEELNKLIIDVWKVHQDTPVDIEARVTAKVNSSSYVEPEVSKVRFAAKSYTPEYTYNPYKAPLYWSPYEYNYVKNSYIPESEWKANIDWVAQNLAPYGYKMVSTDGWGDENSGYNEYGYMTRHSVHWAYDYKYWADYLATKGMSLGVYWNPLWIAQNAASEGVIIKGTNIPLSNILNLNEYTYGYRWVQIDRAGAEEYVKGYVEHFAQMGVKYLRVDFLSFFENGQDRGLGVVGVERPHWIYETALRWIREECDRYGIFLSLVMPHLFNDGETEVKYGHMVRIGEDTGDGGWWKFSENNQGIHQYGWSQYSNPFDGFVYFSRISGRNKMILDGDFIRLNSYADDNERKSVISLNLVAGGPVTVADRYNTIGENLWLYCNEEMLALNADGFVGKPASNDPTNEKSQIWTGQMTNGDWIIGVFNRESLPKETTVRFSDYGIGGEYVIRDLWEHEDKGSGDSYEVSLPSHGCVILRLRKQN